MSRQLDQKVEERVDRRNKAVIRALEFELAGSLETTGITLLGLSMRWDAWDCLITLRADINGEMSVAFVGSDTPINAIVKCVRDTQRMGLKWKADKYKKPNS
jgi:hypothetical protein